MRLPCFVQILTPLIHKDSKNGQMQLIEESHKWGHIPHMDRKNGIQISLNVEAMK